MMRVGLSLISGCASSAGGATCSAGEWLLPSAISSSACLLVEHSAYTYAGGPPVELGGRLQLTEARVGTHVQAPLGRTPPNELRPRCVPVVLLRRDRVHEEHLRAAREPSKQRIEVPSGLRRHEAVLGVGPVHDGGVLDRPERSGVLQPVDR